MSMPQLQDRYLRASAVTHRAQLLSALPPTAVMALNSISAGERPAIRLSINSGASPVKVTWRTCPLFASRIVRVSTSRL